MALARILKPRREPSLTRGLPPSTPPTPRGSPAPDPERLLPLGVRSIDERIARSPKRAAEIRKQARINFLEREVERLSQKTDLTSRRLLLSRQQELNRLTGRQVGTRAERLAKLQEELQKLQVQPTRLVTPKQDIGTKRIPLPAAKAMTQADFFAALREAAPIGVRVAPEQVAVVKRGRRRKIVEAQPPSPRRAPSASPRTPSKSPSASVKGKEPARPKTPPTFTPTPPRRVKTPSPDPFTPTPPRKSKSPTRKVKSPKRGRKDKAVLEKMKTKEEAKQIKAEIRELEKAERKAEKEAKKAQPTVAQLLEKARKQRTKIAAVSLTVKELQQRLRDAGLKVSGKKQELVDRLKEAGLL